MLAEKTYPQDYIDGSRARMDAQLAAYRALVAAKPARAALDSFEPLFFQNLVVALDAYFMHRTRAIEGKDGNPLNEVRILAHSILFDHGVLGVDKTIKYSAATSVVGLAIGDEIRLDEGQFTQLSSAFFAEMEKRFT